MNFLKIFGSDENGVRRSHIKNLVAVALADGQLTDDEWELLVFIASQLEISESEIKNIKDNIDTVGFIPPKSHAERVHQIEDLVDIISIDRDINPKEIELCKKIALRLDLLPQIVDSIIYKK